MNPLEWLEFEWESTWRRRRRRRKIARIKTTCVKSLKRVYQSMKKELKVRDVKERENKKEEELKH